MGSLRYASRAVVWAGIPRLTRHDEEMDSTHRRRRQTPLSTRTIVRTSLALVEREGLAALTMRRVADELGVAPMALYRYVTDRQGLLLGMLDEVAQGIGPVAAAEPREELAEIMHRLHRTFTARPWVVQLLVVDGLASAHIMPLMNQVFDCLQRAGLEPLAAMRAWQLLFQYLVGETMMTHNRSPENSQGQLVFRAAVRAGFPALAPLMQFEGRHEEQADFDTNLNTLLGALL